MKKQRVFSKGIQFSLLILAFLGGTLLAANGQSCGDVNGDGTVNIVDALQIAQHTVGNTPPGFRSNVADVDNNGSITIVDALRLAQYSVGLGVTLNCGSVVTPTRTVATPTPTRTGPTQTSNATHITGNPFSGGKWYVDPVWSENARTGGGAAIANLNTAVWMDRIGAITAGIGLRGHLDACLTQNANLIIVVIYDLPGRDCAASASNGELGMNELPKYKAEYIDPIAAIMADAKYSSLRIICIIEPDSLPNLVTNLDIPKCSEANSTGAYVQGVQYAINKLHAIPNCYLYLDIAHSGWLGWDSNFAPSADLIANCIKGCTAGTNSIDGFISNTANYTPYEEPYLPNSDLQVGGQPIRSADYYAWNPYFDEKDYVTAMHSAFASRGFSSFGMLVDTSRNGWGGTSYGRSRPTRASSSSDRNTYVNESRIDRRYHRGNWCNQDAGLGARPAIAPATNIEAFVWAKPPGESDGVSQSGIVDPNDPAKTFDLMCDPNGNSTYDSAYKTGAMTAPHAGRWNQVQFDALLRNAYPAL